VETKKLSLEGTIRVILIVVVLVLLIISLVGLYTSLNQLISIWVGYKYAPIFRTLLNLAVLILTAYALTLLLKKRSEN